MPISTIEVRYTVSNRFRGVDFSGEWIEPSRVHLSTQNLLRLPAAPKLRRAVSSVVMWDRPAISHIGLSGGHNNDLKVPCTR